MRVLQVYNDYRSEHGGEIGVVRKIASLIERNGGTAMLLMSTSKGLDHSLLRKVRGFASGIYNRAAYRNIQRLVSEDRPDVVHVHNLYPLLSPSVIVACRRAGIPIVMTNHNYVLTCPIVTHLREGRVCEQCMGGHEFWCALNNCRNNIAESIAYAVRSAAAQRLRWFRDQVTIQIVLSDFARRHLIKAGFDPARIVVIPNSVAVSSRPDSRPAGTYVGFSGRLAAEKGIDVLLAAAARLPDIPFRLAGSGPLLDDLVARAPANVTFLNRLDAGQMVDFYLGARLLVVPSRWFEGCPLVVSEAMSHGLPVIASRIGGLPEFVSDGISGQLFEPGNIDELTRAIRLLWDQPDLCQQMGNAGRARAMNEFNDALYYQRLVDAYELAIQLAGRPRTRSRQVIPDRDRGLRCVSVK